jgi:hypothetical protein
MARRLESVAQSEAVEIDKQRAAEDWRPEYTPESILPPGRTPDAIAERTTRTSLAMISKACPAPTVWGFGVLGLRAQGFGI